MRTNSRPKRVATPEDIVRLAKKVNWHDITLPSGDVVPAETIREVFQDAGRGLKRVRVAKRVHATAA